MNSANKKPPAIPGGPHPLVPRPAPRAGQPLVPAPFRPAPAAVQAKMQDVRQKPPAVPAAFLPQKMVRPLPSKLPAAALPPHIAPPVHGHSGRPPALQARRLSGQGVLQCQFDRPAGGRIQMLWDKQKLRLHGLPENGAEDAKTGAQEWADAVLNATDIESLTKLVDEKLADREDRRKKALIAKNEDSAKRHEQHRVEQQALAEQARLKRAEDERLAEERR